MVLSIINNEKTWLISKKEKLLSFRFKIAFNIFFNLPFGSDALPGKMLLVRVIENNTIDAYLGQVRLSNG